MKGTMKRSILYALLRAMALAVSAILAFACVETLDVETGERPIVLRCILTESDTQELDLHYVMKQGETEPVPVVDARAWILSGKDTVARFSKISDGRWSASFRPDFGGKYRLEVESGDQRLAAETEFLDDISLVSRGAHYVKFFSTVLVSYAVAHGTESAKGSVGSGIVPRICHRHGFPIDALPVMIPYQNDPRADQQDDQNHTSDDDSRLFLFHSLFLLRA